MELKMIGFFLCICLLPVLCATAPVQAAPLDTVRLPGTSEAMLQAKFWIDRTASPHQVLLTPAEIEAFNRSITAMMPQTMMDLDQFPDSIDRARLQRWLAVERIPRNAERYSDGEPVSEAVYDQLAQNLNLRGLRDMNPVAWGFTVRRTDLRTFPTLAASSEEENSDDFDLFQETAVNIAEPVAVLHRSADAAWMYVQMYNYRGWLRSADVALSSSRRAWREKWKTESFLVITGTKVAPRESVMGQPVPDWRAGMGTRLPFLGMEKAGYAIEIPQRGADGLVVWRRAWIHGKADVSTGYLPYTRAHILRQAFKMLGENYGWGGLNEGRDCSSFIMDIYNVFGIRSPRNADQQEKVPGRQIAFQGISDSPTRYALLARRAEPGATLHMRNHVMLYLGEESGKHYAIHSLGSYGDAAEPHDDGTLPRVEVMRVVVGGLDVTLRSGRRFIDVLTSANVWRP